jgi:hypothetical protein
VIADPVAQWNHNSVRECPHFAEWFDTLVALAQSKPESAKP